MKMYLPSMEDKWQCKWELCFQCSCSSRCSQVGAPGRSRRKIHCICSLSFLRLHWDEMLHVVSGWWCLLHQTVLSLEGGWRTEAVFVILPFSGRFMHILSTGSLCRGCPVWLPLGRWGSKAVTTSSKTAASITSISVSSSVKRGLD